MIEIKINKKTLEIEIEGIDYVGTACVPDLDKLCEMLELEVTDRKPKPEMFVVQQSQQHIRR
ncbi:MAG: hypothetical protein DRI22_01040 [Caldiserica bacterium]|nr:MAG: hypothetical protein DRI22_01040 [Caldisericota bacterium]